MTAGQMKLFNLLSGGVAGTFAACLTNPLEVVKTQLQSSSTSTTAHGGLASAHGKPLAIIKKIVETDGLPGFFRGLRPTLIGIIPSRSVYFYAYEQTKRAVNPIFREGSVGNAIVSGLAAGVAGNTLTNPIWLVKTRMQLLADSSAGQKVYTGYRDAVSTILREEGVGGFYKGLSASYWGCAEGCVQFVIYEKVKKSLLEKTNAERAAKGLPPVKKLPKLVYFSSAALAKCVAAVTTYPHEVARTRLREQARNSVFKYNGMWQAIGLIAKEEGRRGLYAGMGMHLLKVVPNSAIMFLTYEVVNAWLGQIQIREE
eukprot:CAMPEP_0172517844 /NCGR_PEP_ID=MMETSP1066-20121228/288360_1 /TAXON_ID=671091 /ORGANISM="Coscinodiscus wailesii, Strain CCMP2513" /LENGTH=313 /DNA_ID=CAMNT_0013300029 /DNA_START=366 /DNA_END=1307 /DNA_ORIENTATION=+